MTIAIYIRSSSNGISLANNLHYQCFVLLAEKYPEHTFTFISDRPLEAARPEGSNIKVLMLPPLIRNRLLRHYWFNYKLPNVLAKINAALFISNGAVCSLRTNVRQCMILEDLTFLDKKNLYAESDLKYIRKYISKFFKKASLVAVTHPLAASILESRYPEVKGKTGFIGFGRNSWPLKITAADMQAIKDKHTGGNEYFIAFINDASADHTLLLLKAYSLFKKRQLSNMKLVLLITTAEKNIPVPGLETYKYRDEIKVIFPGEAPELFRITASAYAAIYLPDINIHDNQCMLSLFYEVPVIVPDHAFYHALYGDAALYSMPDEKKLAASMMAIYKDENHRDELVSKGRLVSATYTWEQTADRLWQFIQDSAVQTA